MKLIIILACCFLLANAELISNDNNRSLNNSSSNEIPVNATGSQSTHDQTQNVVAKQNPENATHVQTQNATTSTTVIDTAQNSTVKGTSAQPNNIDQETEKPTSPTTVPTTVATTPPVTSAQTRQETKNTSPSVSTVTQSTSATTPPGTSVQTNQTRQETKNPLPSTTSAPASSISVLYEKPEDVRQNITDPKPEVQSDEVEKFLSEKVKPGDKRPKGKLEDDSGKPAAKSAAIGSSQCLALVVVCFAFLYLCK